ncbi:hypothetical protein [Rubellimicrobium roseum]|uniref:Uncharacterized protein n=1 Tax=Rubellimicrobium roseum TaxID=687525 RepID=A0A5C4NCQ4_9RHOB|nr:hypothetical protein [Rubellimicrobium roseum]TNC72574.1 hypothetical protein FHG71_07840 [Rubellimicrobium roseum]
MENAPLTVLGFNLRKGELHYCSLGGSKSQPIYVAHGRDPFDPSQSRAALSHFFRQTFGEVIGANNPDQLAYRLSMDAKSADQMAYLVFPFGVLNLLGFEKGLPTHEFTSQSFTPKALGYKGDKLAACDELIACRPNSWPDGAKYAALAAWMVL